MVSEKAKLGVAIECGNAMKRHHGFGKEYYALYTGHMPDAILEFISGKIDEMYPQLRQNSWVSVTGVAFRLMELKEKVYVVVDEHLYIHKASFKRYLKRAICRNRNKL